MPPAGLDRHDMIITTILASILGLLLVALLATLPIALAPTMNSNIIFAQILVVHMGLMPSIAFTVVFLSAFFDATASY
jgi:AGZA family xanthine/uracil permease-like MFS transporter